MTAIKQAGTQYGNSGVFAPPEDAVALSAIRGLPNGAMRQYSAMGYARGWAGVEAAIRRFWALGMLAPSKDDGYAVLDVLNADGDEIADYTVRTAEGWAYIKKQIGLTVVDTDAIARSVASAPNPSGGAS